MSFSGFPSMQINKYLLSQSLLPNLEILFTENHGLQPKPVLLSLEWKLSLTGRFSD